jgi:hypothetical protein
MQKLLEELTGSTQVWPSFFRGIFVQNKQGKE